jgi:ribosomal protein S18 acetylase RimI-like enzyme
MSLKNKLDFHVRFMNARDREELLRIDRASYKPALTAEELHEIIAARDSYAMVAEHGDIVVGYVLYHKLPQKYIIERLGVQPEFLQCGVGRALAKVVIDKLSFTRRDRVETCASEYNTRGHLFLKACGFSAIAVMRDYLEDGHDAYLFEYSIS